MSDADPLNPHSHEPNPEPPSPDPTLTILWSHGRSQPISITQLQQFTAVTLENCTIVSTGHGTSGPFSLTGPPLLDVVEAYAPAGWSQVEVVSGDGFGTRIFATELTFPHAKAPSFWRTPATAVASPARKVWCGSLSPVKQMTPCGR
jgi:hypothetical protein